MITLKEIQKAASDQQVTLTVEEIAQLFKVNDIVKSQLYWRVSKRIEALRRAGYEVTQKPMHTGYGVVLCMRRMHDGSLRVRVSANWGGKQTNYAYCVHI